MSELQPEGFYVTEATEELKAQGIEEPTWQQVHSLAWDLQAAAESVE